MHRHLGTVRFFKNHPWLARTVPGRRALHVARVWIPIVRRELAETRAALKPKPQSVPQIICEVFGRNCATALRVFNCESHYYVGARNGQYFGIAQMGSAERARFGGSSLDPWDQVRAAYRYFSIAGWGPWECA